MKQILLLIPLMMISPLTPAGDGKALHDEQCTKCHDDSVYKRENRIIKDRDALARQVKRCQLNVGAQWFDEDVEAVVNYLDDSYYKFGTPAQ